MADLPDGEWSLRSHRPPGQGAFHDAEATAAGPGPRGFGNRLLGPQRGLGPGGRRPPDPLPLLPVLLLAAQLLADAGPAVARTAGRPLHASAGLPGLPALPRRSLAL